IGRVSDVTNENGKLQVRLPPGVHSYSINAKGYAKATGRFDVDERKDTQVQVIDLTPIGKGDVFVRVRSSGSSKPIEKATVWLAQQIQLSDGKGEAKFLGMPFGKHRLFVDAPGYKERETLVLHNSDSAKGTFTEIELEPKKPK